jgi:hypothetical protein
MGHYVNLEKPRDQGPRDGEKKKRRQVAAAHMTIH